MQDQPHGFDMRWIADRLDKLEQANDEKFDRLSDEIAKSRHGLREVIEQVAIQVADLVRVSFEHERRITEGEASHRRKGDRLGAIERRQSFQAGGIAVLCILFPVTVGAIVALLA